MKDKTLRVKRIFNGWFAVVSGDSATLFETPNEIEANGVRDFLCGVREGEWPNARAFILGLDR